MTWFLLLIPWIVHGIKFQDKNNWPSSSRSKSFNSDWPQYKKAFVRAVLDSSRARFPFHEKNIFLNLTIKSIISISKKNFFVKFKIKKVLEFLNYDFHGMSM